MNFWNLYKIRCVGYYRQWLTVGTSSSVRNYGSAWKYL